MRQNVVAQFVQLLKLVMWDVGCGIVMEKNWALSVDQSWQQALQFSVHLIDLLSVLLRCNSFTGVQKAVVDQFRQQTTKHLPWHFFSCKCGFGKCFRACTQFIH